jgi:aldehyde dehydrogenase (NAD+)
MRLPETRLYVDGVVRPAAGGKLYDVIGPWTGDVVTHAADASADDVEEAIAAARRAFDTTDWAVDHAGRLALVKKFAEALKAKRELLVDIARHEVGSAMAGVHWVQVDGALAGMDTLIKLFPQVKWEEDKGSVESNGVKSDRLVVFEAVGVAAAITPWNVPLYVNLAKVVSGLLAGCTMILKPAPDTPSFGAVLGDAAAEAGFPAGVFNVITGSDPAMAGEMLTTDRAST